MPDLMENSRTKAQLIEGIHALSLEKNTKKIEQWLHFLALLSKWNKAYNLTAIKNPIDMVTHHLLDSLAIAPFLHERRHIDVGTGAGIPGIPLAILLPKHHFVLLDSVGKKTRFMATVKRELALDNITIVNQRVETYQADVLFDTVITRAFAPLQKMLPLTAHLLMPGGYFLAMKAKHDIEREPLPPGYQITLQSPILIPGLNATRQVMLIQKPPSRQNR